MPEAYPRDLIGYGRTPPDPRWPGAPRIAVQFVLTRPWPGQRIRLRRARFWGIWWLFGVERRCSSFCARTRPGAGVRGGYTDAVRPVAVPRIFVVTTFELG